MQQNQFKIKLIGRTMITPSVLHLTFSRSDKLLLEFIPGQFITFLLPHQNGKIVRRSYSLASSPNQPHEIQIAVAPVHEGFATKILFNLKVGDELLCTGPVGRLILKEEESPSHYLLVATGTGIAPYRSMLPTIAQRLVQDKNLQVTLLLGVRYAKDSLYVEDFLSFAKQHNRFHFRTYLSKETILFQSYQYVGYVQSAFEQLNLNPSSDLVYLCGNPHMIDESVVLLQELGFDSKHIRREKYISTRIKL